VTRGLYVMLVIVAIAAWAFWMLSQPVSADLSLNPNNHAPEAIWGIR